MCSVCVSFYFGSHHRHSNTYAHTHTEYAIYYVYAKPCMLFKKALISYIRICMYKRTEIHTCCSTSVPFHCRDSYCNGVHCYNVCDVM